MPNEDLDLSVRFDLDQYIAQATRADEILDGIGAKAEETAQRVTKATEQIGESWRIERTKEEDAAEAWQRKLNQIYEQAEREEQQRTEAIERENEKRAKSYEQLLKERDRQDREYRALQRAHDQALKEDAARNEGFFEREGGNQLKHGLRTASILSGIRDSRSIDAFLGGFGGVAGIAGIGGALAVGATVNLVRNAAQQAQDLKKLSDVMGISITQASKLSFAANIAGENMDTMASASRKLADALENPGTTGKKTAEALIELGVSLREDVGGAFQDAAQRLIAIQDPTKQAALGARIFGQEWRGVLETFRELPNVGEGIDANLNEKLVEANRNIKEFGNYLKIVEGYAASMAISVGNSVHKAVQATRGFDLSENAIAAGMYGDSFAWNKSPNLPFNGPKTNWQVFNPGDPKRLDAALHNGSKIDLQEKLATARKDLATAEMQGRSDRKSQIGNYDEDAKAITNARKEVERLEQAIKNADKAAANAQRLPELLAEWRDRAHELGQKGAVASLDEKYNKEIRQYGLKPFSNAWTDLTANYGLLRADAVKKQQEQEQRQALELKTLEERMAASVKAAQDKATGDLSKSLTDINNPLSKVFAPLPELPPTGLLSARNQGALNTAFAKGAVELNQAFNPEMNQSEIAKENLSLRLQEVEATRQLAIEEAKALEPAKQQAEIEKANTEATVQRYQTIIQYEQQIAQIRAQQLNETRQFASGFFNAAISGQPGAGGNFLRSWARGFADKIVGNVAAETFGTFNSKLTLQRNPNKPGLLSDGKGHETFLGKIFEGTPFGIDAANMKLDPKTLAQNKNTDALTGLTSEIQELISAIAQASGISLPSVPGGMKGTIQAAPAKAGNSAGNIIVSTAGKGLGIVKSVESGDVSGGLSQALRIATGGTTPKFTGETPVFSGTTGSGADVTALAGALAGMSTGSGRRAAQTQAVANGIGLFTDPVTAFSRALHRVGAASDSPGGTPTFLPSRIGSDGGAMLPYNGPDITLQIPNLPGANTGAFTPPKGSYDPESALAADPNGMRGVLASMGFKDENQAATDVNAGMGISAKLSNMLGGGKYVMSGQAPGAIFNGSVQNDDGTWTELSTSQRWGAGLGLAATTGGGAFAAYSGFSKGGARGDLQGIAGTAEAIAPFTGPAAPIVAGVGALVGMIGSLFPDPRQQRIKQEQKTLLANAYLQPAAKDYNFSAGDNSEGFSYGMNGAVREGGPTANYTFHIQAMDASTFVDFGQRNPQAMAQAMLFGLTNGSNSAIDAEIQWRASHAGLFG